MQAFAYFLQVRLEYGDAFIGKEVLLFRIDGGDAAQFIAMGDYSLYHILFEHAFVVVFQYYHVRLFNLYMAQHYIYEGMLVYRFRLQHRCLLRWPG